MAPIIKI